MIIKMSSSTCVVKSIDYYIVHIEVGVERIRLRRHLLAARGLRQQNETCSVKHKLKWRVNSGWVVPKQGYGSDVTPHTHIQTRQLNASFNLTARATRMTEDDFSS